MLLKTNMIDEANKLGKNHSPFKHMAIFFLVFIISTTIMNIVVTMFTMVYMYSDSSIISLMSEYDLDLNSLFTRILELMTIMPEWLLLVNIFSYSLLGLGAVVYCCFIYKRTLSSMGFRKKYAFVEYIKGLLLGLLALVIILLLALLLNIVSFNGIYDFSPYLLVMYFIGSLLYGISQELMFRGYYMTSLMKTYNIIYSFVLSSVIFAFLNVSIIGGSYLSFINYTILGLALSLYTVKRGNIWGASAFHGIWFFTQIAMFGVGTDSTRIFDLTINENLLKALDSGFGLHSGIVSTLVLFLTFGFVLLLKQNPQEIVNVDSKE